MAATQKSNILSRTVGLPRSILLVLGVCLSASGFEEPVAIRVSLMGCQSGLHLVVSFATTVILLKIYIFS